MIYRIHFWDESCSSNGFEYFGNKAAAIRALVLYYNESDIATLWDLPDYIKSHLDENKTPATKTEIMALLERWGSHPDNG